MKLLTALHRALKDLPQEPTDFATVELAKKYASLIDGVNIPERISYRLIAVLVDEFGVPARRAGAIVDRLYEDHTERLGPRLLEVLVELGMTPKARQSVMRGGIPASDGDDSNKIAELRSRRERRAAHLDAASS